MGLFDFFKSKHRLVYDNGAVVIEYDTAPPNFRDSEPDEIGLYSECGGCKFCKNIRTTQPVCEKYGVTFKGNGCLTKTVCDDYKELLLELF